MIAERELPVPGTAETPDLAALCATVEHMAAETAALEAQIGQELAHDGDASQPPGWHELAGRVLPLTGNDDVRTRTSRRLASLERRRIRLLRESAVLLDQAQELQERGQYLRERLARLAEWSRRLRAATLYGMKA